MKLEIVNRTDVALPTPEAETIRKLVARALSKLAHLVDSVRIQVIDGHGQKGGTEKHCLVAVHLYGGAPLFVSSKQLSNIGAATVAAERLREALNQFCRKQLERANRFPQRGLVSAAA